MPGGVSETIKSLILVLYIAAARAAATNDQVIALRRPGALGLDEYRQGEIDEEEVMDRVDEIMGGSWDLPEDFAQQLEDLGFTGRNSG